MGSILLATRTADRVITRLLVQSGGFLARKGGWQGGHGDDLARPPAAKVHGSAIVILKGLPVFLCGGCTGYLLEDPVIQRVDKIIKKVDIAAELEVIKYAA